MLDIVSDKIDKAKGFLDNLVSRLTGEYKYVNKEYFPIYMREVDGDIECLEIYIKYSKFERDNEWLFNFLIDKYKKEYCPCLDFPKFSRENELEYLYRRVKIDDIIEKSESPFSDFLSED